MKADQKPVNDRQRRFCEEVAGGMAAGRAYERAGYRARGDSADSAASRLLKNPAVWIYLARLRSTAPEFSENPTKNQGAATARDAAAWLTARQRKFTNAVVAGQSAREAYQASGFAARGHAAAVEASKLLRLPPVARYVELLREEAAMRPAMDRQGGLPAVRFSSSSWVSVHCGLAGRRTSCGPEPASCMESVWIPGDSVADGEDPDSRRRHPGNPVAGVARQVLLHSSHVCQIGESDQGHSGLFQLAQPRISIYSLS